MQAAPEVSNQILPRTNISILGTLHRGGCCGSPGSEVCYHSTNIKHVVFAVAKREFLQVGLCSIMLLARVICFSSARSHLV